MATPFDWTRYAVGGAASRKDSFSRLNPDYASRVAQLVQAAERELGPRALTITSAYRSPELQAKIFRDAVAKYGSEKAARKWVAPPGKSKHNAGMAVDFGDARGRLLRDPNSREAKWIKENAARFGLDVPMSWEPWQVELAGSRGGMAGGGGMETMAGGSGGDDLSQPAPAPSAEPVDFSDLVDFGDAGDVTAAYASAGAFDDLVDFGGAPQAEASQGGAMRGLGLGLRNVAEGAAGALGILSDPIAATMNMAGANIPPLRAAVSSILTELGVPQPETAAERIIGAIQQGATGGAMSAGVGGIAAGAPGMIGQMGRAMASGPVAQMTGGAGAGAGSQIAAEAGAGPLVQAGAGLLGGVAAGGLGAAAMRATGRPDAMIGTPMDDIGPVGPRDYGPLSFPDDAPPAAAPALAPAAPKRIEPPVTRAAPPAPDVTMDDVQRLLVQAQGRGRSSRAALRELAKVAKVDPEAMAAAERLGIDLPVDVFSESVPVREVAGAIRGLKLGQGRADFFEALEAAQGRAASLMDEIDGARSISEVSAGVRSSILGTIDDLRAKAGTIYDAVDAAVPKSSPVTASKAGAVLSQTMEELGGLSRMTAQEKTLVSALTNADEPLTYAGLIRLKQDIGRALERGQGPFSDVNTATLKRLYGALADDQISAVATLGGDDLAASLKVANGLVSSRKELEDGVARAFGKDLEGSIASTLKNAVTQASKGDIGNLNRALAVIPKAMHKEAVGAAISDLATVRRGSSPGAFSFEEYAKLYVGMRNNPPVYKKITDALGPEAHALMRDLYQVSAAVSRAKAAIPTTGQSNQILQAGALAAEGLAARVMKTTTGQTIARASTTAAGGIAGGIPGAIAADAVGSALTKARPDKMAAAAKLLASDEFKSLSVALATQPQAVARNQAAVLASPAFRSFAKATGISDPAAWLKSAIVTGAVVGNEGGAQ